MPAVESGIVLDLSDEVGQNRVPGGLAASCQIALAERMDSGVLRVRPPRGCSSHRRYNADGRVRGRAVRPLLRRAAARQIHMADCASVPSTGRRRVGRSGTWRRKCVRIGFAFSRQIGKRPGCPGLVHGFPLGCSTGRQFLALFRPPQFRVVGQFHCAFHFSRVPPGFFSLAR